MRFIPKFPRDGDGDFEWSKFILSMLIFNGIILTISIITVRAISAFRGSTILFFMEKGVTGEPTPKYPGVLMPGGFTFEDSLGFIGMTLQISMVAMSLLLLLFVRTAHRNCDTTAFMLVDAEKIRKLGRLLKLAYGIAVFAFVLGAFSVIFDVVLTTTMFTGHQYTSVEAFARWMEVNYPWVLASGFVLSLAIAAWWSITTEYPRDIEFSAE